MALNDAERTVSQERSIQTTAFFQPVPPITAVAGINPVKISHFKPEGYQLNFYKHVKNKELCSQIRGYFN